MRSKFDQAGYDLLSVDLLFVVLKNWNKISCHLGSVIRSRFVIISYDSLFNDLLLD